jgi:hypothetical protein
MRVRTATATALLTGSLALAPMARADKKLTVKLTHPASAGHLLAGKRVVIGPVTGECSREFSQMLEPDLSSHGMFVVSRGELNSILAKNHIQLGLPMDPSSAVRLGKVLGSSAMLTVEISHCDARPKPPSVGQGMPATFTSRMEGSFQAQVHMIDLADGRELGSQPLHAEAAKENQTLAVPPPYPGRDEVKTLTLAKALIESEHLYLPWTEAREVSFSDDKECNLKQAYELMKSGDYDGALQLSRDNARSCNAAPKVAAGAWNNLGVALMVKRNYAEAVSAFEQGRNLNGKTSPATLIADCQNDRSITDAAKPMALPEQPHVRVETAIVMTNDFVMKLVEGNVAEEEIVKMITNQPGRFNLGPNDLGKMKAVGTPEAVLSAMLSKR